MIRLNATNPLRFIVLKTIAACLMTMLLYKPSQAASVAQIQGWNKQAFSAYEANRVRQAARFYFKASLAGDASARYNLASMKVRQETTLISQSKANLWLKQTAQSGLSPAQFSYGLLLELGEHLPRDIAQANAWFEKAAKQGHAEASLSLATAYFLGRGIEQDDAKAAYWYEKAAEGGEVAAQYSLATMYLQGHGVAKNLDQALNWFTQAARQGDLAAKEMARVLTQTLTRERSN